MWSWNQQPQVSGTLAGMDAWAQPSSKEAAHLGGWGDGSVGSGLVCQQED